MTHAPRKVYTRKGDDGTTGLFHGGRIGKDAPGPAAYGDVDEAVSALGLARALTKPGTDLYELLLRLQRELFVAGAELATEPGKRDRLEPGVSLVTPEMVTALEPVIDDVTTRFDPPQEFVLPGENELAAALDLARAVVRRAERRCLGLPGTPPEVMAYLNRMSLLLFILGRYEEHRAGAETRAAKA